MGEVAKRLQQQIQAWARVNVGVIRVTERVVDRDGQRPAPKPHSPQDK